MISRLLVSLSALLAVPCVAAWATAVDAIPLASHRAAYALSLVDPSASYQSSAQTPVSASGLIAYEFRGSACEGYSSNFRQVTEMERSEGDPLSMQVNAVSFEAGDGKTMRFQVDTTGSQETPPVVGAATRSVDDDVKVQLTKPASKTLDFGHDVLFPTQHIERLIEAAKAGGGAIQARVYDGSDTGAKIYSTMAIVGKEATKPSDDAAAASELKSVRRWPVVVSYFNEASKDSTPRIHPLLRSLRERRVGNSEARLRDLRAARPAQEAGDPADDGLREIASAPSDRAGPIDNFLRSSCISDHALALPRRGAKR